MLAALSHTACAVGGLITIVMLTTLAAAGKPTPKAPERHSTQD